LANGTIEGTSRARLTDTGTNHQICASGTLAIGQEPFRYTGLTTLTDGHNEKVHTTNLGDTASQFAVRREDSISRVENVSGVGAGVATNDDGCSSLTKVISNHGDEHASVAFLDVIAILRAANHLRHNWSSIRHVLGRRSNAG